MKRSRKINSVMYELLIERDMDGFSVIELRDASLSIEGGSLDLEESRKVVYRQILRFLKNEWLTCTGKGRGKRYFKTESFKSISMAPKAIIHAKSEVLNYSVLEDERNHYKGELEITLGEIEEYQSLNRRFPELVQQITPLLNSAKERSANLLGKVNVLTHVLQTLRESDSRC
ncbi:hypothetical protein [Vibrio sp. 99-70-13A1]|uniref:hypothetical protein n=1 Tax=Vibrio sp. 99-70-13A1 TaxID=2607601 RepID=UPI0014936552|nr:hypothetical protein [Vibrio sp. 99-70-13A1]NOH97824.1 hypothetical protein [Vibrio sp. 99-70-13A1]